LRIRIVALYKGDLGYMKIGNTLKLSYSTGLSYLLCVLNWKVEKRHVSNSQ